MYGPLMGGRKEEEEKKHLAANMMKELMVRRSSLSDRRVTGHVSFGLVLGFQDSQDKGRDGRHFTSLLPSYRLLHLES